MLHNWNCLSLAGHDELSRQNTPSSTTALWDGASNRPSASSRDIATRAPAHKKQQKRQRRIASGVQQYLFEGVKRAAQDMGPEIAPIPPNTYQLGTRSLRLDRVGYTVADALARPKQTLRRSDLFDVDHNDAHRPDVVIYWRDGQNHSTLDADLFERLAGNQAVEGYYAPCNRRRTVIAVDPLNVGMTEAPRSWPEDLELALAANVDAAMLHITGLTKMDALTHVVVIGHSLGASSAIASFAFLQHAHVTGARLVLLGAHAQLPALLEQAVLPRDAEAAIQWGSQVPCVGALVRRLCRSRRPQMLADAAFPVRPAGLLDPADPATNGLNNEASLQRLCTPSGGLNPQNLRILTPRWATAAEAAAAVRLREVANLPPEACPSEQADADQLVAQVDAWLDVTQPGANA